MPKSGKHTGCCSPQVLTGCPCSLYTPPWTKPNLAKYWWGFLPHSPLVFGSFVWLTCGFSMFLVLAISLDPTAHLESGPCLHPESYKAPGTQSPPFRRQWTHKRCFFLPLPDSGILHPGGHPFPPHYCPRAATEDQSLAPSFLAPTATLADGMS